MPLYEYTCSSCHKRFTWLVGVVANSGVPTCDRCGSIAATRREVSRFRQARSSADSIPAIDDPAALGDPADPATMERWAKSVSNEMGEGLGEEFDEYIADAHDDAG
ncbi:MAG TPA: FmdB family zinc ribbon protein [Capsulimonadaceae bacterium]|jgi:putative FmdB family regulatory protein